MPRETTQDQALFTPPADPGTGRRGRIAAARPARRARGAGADAYQLKITLKGVRPPVWRRVVVPGGITLARLHHIVQAAMGWSDTHLHEWQVAGQSYGGPDPDWPDADMRSETRARLDALAGPGDRLSYWYDFGDDWRHDVLVEDVRGPEPGERLPRCLTGRRACPPEDVGGPWGYAAFLEAYTDPEHPEHDEWVAWAGPYFSPAGFDREGTDALLKRFAS